MNKRIFIFLLCLFWGLLGIAQNKPISIQQTNVSLKQLFATLQSDYGYRFMYSNSDIDDTKTVSISVNNTDISVVLDKVLAEQNVSYEIKDMQVVLKPAMKQNTALTITGKVTDDTGAGMPVVNVLLKGTSVGVLTNDDGSYSITVPANTRNASLLYSFIGYTEKVEVVGNRSAINVNLSSSISKLDEVVVVGYGTQKRENLTGAVAQVSGDVLEGRPITNLGQGLQGVIPNLQINPAGNAPGQGAKFNIRGYSSLNAGGPLILVDGVEQDPNLLNPEDIASVSVLKDAASASIYGARAAFGVVLITTKKGKRDQAPTINVSGSYSINKATRLPKYVDSWEYLNYMDLANMNTNGSPFFDARSREHIEKYYLDPANNSPVYYDPSIDTDGKYRYSGNTDWTDALYKNGAIQQYTANLSGGSEKTQYYVSYGLLRQDGILATYDDKYSRHNISVNLNTDVLSWLTFGTKVKYTYATEDHPSGGSNGNSGISEYTGQLKNDLMPIMPIKHPDGNWAGQGNNTNPFAVGAEGGYDQRKTNDLWLTGLVTMRPLKDLNVNIDFTYNPYSLNKERTSRRFKEYHADGTFNIYPWSNPNSIALYNNNNYYTAFNAYTDYSKTINADHNFKVMVGYNQEVKNSKYYYAKRENLINNDLPAINLATGNQTVGGTNTSWGVQGVFARFNYNYKEKYLLEMNGRYDASSKFPSGNRSAFFPSASGAWRITKESFMESTQTWLSELKLRASYGSLGNQNVSTDFPYVPNYDVSTTPPDYIFGTDREISVGAPGLVSNNFTWEKVEQWNIGLDYGILNNKLSGSLDIFQRQTKGMLVTGRPLPGVLGTDTPKSNAADLKTSGWELAVAWRDNIGEFSYHATLSLSDSKAEISKFDNPTGTLSGDGHYKGKMIGEIWGYQSEGLFQSDTEVTSHVSQSKLYGGKWNPGDVKYQNTNGDNEISNGDNTIYNSGDKSIIGNSSPRYEYGIMLGGSWKGFDLDLFFQGVGKRDYVPDGRFFGMDNMWEVALKDALDVWQKESPNGFLPNPYISEGGSGRGNRETSTRYLQNAAYLRLKQLSVGYTLPQEWISKVGIKKVRIYFTGQNLLTFTKLSKIYDPEVLYDAKVISGTVVGTMAYPVTKSFSFGVNLTF